MMRTVSASNGRIQVTDDPLSLVRDTIEYALSPPLSEELDARFAPDGKGFHLEDTFTVSRARQRDELPEEFWEDPPLDPEREEVWVMGRETWRGGPDYGLIEGGELRRLLAEARDLYAAMRGRAPG